MEVAATRARSFAAADGRRWLVREHLVTPRSGGRPQALLLFESRSVLRWTRRFPPEWRALSDAELEALSWEV